MIDIEYFFNTPDCFVISDGINQAVGYICNSDEVDRIDSSGDSIYVSYLQGDMSLLLSFIPEGVLYVIFERDGNGKIKRYDVERFRRIIDYKSSEINNVKI